MWHTDALSGPAAPARRDDGRTADPTTEFVHDLNNFLLAMRGHTTTALIALDGGDAALGETDAAAELRSLLEVVDQATAASRAFRRTLTMSAP
jgi:hypothetical protein